MRKKTFNQAFSNDNTEKKLFLTVYFITHGKLKNLTQWPNIRQRKILFLKETSAVRINVYVLLHCLLGPYEKNM